MKISNLIASATILSIGLLFSSSVIAGDKQKLPFVGTYYREKWKYYDIVQLRKLCQTYYWSYLQREVLKSNYFEK